MKILLVYPHCLEDRLHAEDAGVVPMGLYFVGAQVKAHGYDVEILNWHHMGRTPERIPELLAQKRPDVLGLSILHANRWGGIDIARTAKALNPAVRIVFGGIGATHLWRHFLTHFIEVDYVVLGEGEVTFLELVRRLGGETAGPPDTIAGLAFRKKGRPFKTRARKPLADLDQLPDPTRWFSYQHLALTRGCPGKCTFCGSPRFWGPRVRFHSADYFVGQMERLCARGQNFFFVSDDTFTLRKPLVVEVCRNIVDKRLPVTWAAISRVDTVDAEMLLWMRRAGCVQISYGVESGSEAQRRFLNKHISREQIRHAFSLTLGHGIMARAYFIYGFPGENRAAIQESLDLMDEIRPLSAIFYILDIFPGTALYDDFKRRTGATDDVWLDRIEDIMYFETDPSLTPEDVLGFGKTLRGHFYGRLPHYAESVALIDRPELYPLHADFCSRLAMTFDQGDYAGVEAIAGKERIAEKFYRKALDYGPDARAFLGLGILAQKHREYAASVEILQEGLAHFPQDAQLNICLSVSLMNTGRFESALERLLPLQHLPETHGLIAGCREALGKR